MYSKSFILNIIEQAVFTEHTSDYTSELQAHKWIISDSLSTQVIGKEEDQLQRTVSEDHSEALQRWRSSTCWIDDDIKEIIHLSLIHI